MSIATVITARGGSKSIPKKNIYPVAGHPLLHYPIEASKNSELINYTYVDTDCEQIAKYARESGAQIIARPEFLSGDDVDHFDVISHSCNSVLSVHPDVDIFVILLGNTTMINAEEIDIVLRSLLENTDATGACTVWEAADDHPYRALEIKDCYLQSSSIVKNPTSLSTDRNSYPKTYFYDQGVWAFRSSNLIGNKRVGPGPWKWLGHRVIPHVRPWITGRDVNGYFDIQFHEHWVKTNASRQNFIS